MIRYWIQYICILLFIGFVYYLFEGYLFLVFLVLTCIIPILSMIGYSIGRKQFQFTCDENNGDLIIKSKGILCPFAYMEIEIEAMNYFTQDTYKQNYQLYIGGKNTYRLPFIDSIHVGLYKIINIKVKAYDDLKLLRKTIKTNMKRQWIVFPKENIEANYILNKQMLHHDKKWQEAMLEDQHEVKEYEKQDNLKHIHHKLSHKYHKLMLRKFDYEKAKPFRLYIDTSSTVDHVEKVLEVSKKYILNGILIGKIDVLWNSLTQHHLNECENVNDVERLIEEILSNPKSDTRTQMKDIDMMIASQEDGEVIVYEKND